MSAATTWTGGSARDLARGLFGAVMLVALLGCGDAAQPAGGSASAKPATSGAKAASSGAATGSAAQASTQAPAASASAAAADFETDADFEEEADKDISSANYEDELAKLEKELE